jgi:hypothetical protein
MKHSIITPEKQRKIIDQFKKIIFRQYGVALKEMPDELQVNSLIATQPSIEKWKYDICFSIFESTLDGKYNHVPIVGFYDSGDSYVIDGHSRTKSWYDYRKKIQRPYKIEIPSRVLYHPDLDIEIGTIRAAKKFGSKKVINLPFI